jgi:hypothetical protein
MTPAINTTFKLTDRKAETFKIYNVCGNVICACLLGKNGQMLAPNAKTLKAIDLDFWNKSISIGFISVIA